MPSASTLSSRPARSAGESAGGADAGAVPSQPRPGDTLRLLITGGGTGGHVTPAVAVIQAIRARAAAEGWCAEFYYLGSRTGLERRAALELGVEFTGIDTGKLRRARNPLKLLSRANLRDALRVPLGYAQALLAARRIRPDAALSTGGYVSVPGALACAALRVPVAAHEQTVQVGLANRANFAVASVIALSVGDTLAALPAAQRRRAVVTGNPVRQVIFHGDAARAARLCGFAPADDALPALYVTGGAQGSRLINEAVRSALPALTERWRVAHQCGAGEQEYERLAGARAALPPALRARYFVTQFVGPEIGDVYALADLVVGRSGAGTVTELCAVGKPGVLVPLVPTGGDEQTRNARRLEQAGAAAILTQGDCDGAALVHVLGALLDGGRDKIAAMGAQAATLARPGAAEALADAVVALACAQRRNSAARRER